jgi:hypothetical protein
MGVPEKASSAAICKREAFERQNKSRWIGNQRLLQLKNSLI